MTSTLDRIATTSAGFGEARAGWTTGTNSEAALRQRLDAGTLDGTPFKPDGDNPVGYLVYTPDGHVFAQFATSGERNWPGPEVLTLPPYQRMAALGFIAYCGTFDIGDGQVVHHREFGVFP